MKLLLINPRSPESFWTFRWAVSLREYGERHFGLSPVALARRLDNGDRISIVLDRRLRDVVTIDSSVFHLVLTEP